MCSLMNATDLLEGISNTSRVLCSSLFCSVILLQHLYLTLLFSVWERRRYNLCQLEIHKPQHAPKVVNRYSVVTLVDTDTDKLIAKLPGMCHGQWAQRHLHVVEQAPNYLCKTVSVIKKNLTYLNNIVILNIVCTLSVICKRFVHWSLFEYHEQKLIHFIWEQIDLTCVLLECWSYFLFIHLQSKFGYRKLMLAKEF